MCHFLNRDCSLGEQLALPFLEDMRPLRGHLYVIIDRDEPVKGLEFCSMWCTETYVATMPGGWEISSEFFAHSSRRQNVTTHYVEIRRRRDGYRSPREAGVH